MSEVNDGGLQYAIDNAQAWLDNCEDCRASVNRPRDGDALDDATECSECRFWKRELALLRELQGWRAIGAAA